MGKLILVTGGAGFIGSHVADELLGHGYRVRVLDVLDAQVHGPDPQRPTYLDSRVDFQQGDIRDPAAVRAALSGVDAVCHLAAAVGVAQSMYQVAHYTAVNNLGTALLLEALIEDRSRLQIERLVVASSMSIYGEGVYCKARSALTTHARRTPDQLRRGDWEVRDDRGQALAPVPTPESKSPDAASVYALSKWDQERLCLIVGRAYRLPVVALRFFNTYGPRQSLSNPYTGVLAIFASRLLNGQPPLVFEDGLQMRDFVSVHDVARACRLALEAPGAADQVFNIASGVGRSILEVAERLAEALGVPHVKPLITGRYRAGDIRHCIADINLARGVLGYEPRVALDEGLAELAEWLTDQAAVDRMAEATAELAARGLTVGTQS